MEDATGDTSTTGPLRGLPATRKRRWKTTRSEHLIPGILRISHFQNQSWIGLGKQAFRLVQFVAQFLDCHVRTRVRHFRLTPCALTAQAASRCPPGSTDPAPWPPARRSSTRNTRARSPASSVNRARSAGTGWRKTPPNNCAGPHGPRPKQSLLAPRRGRLPGQSARRNATRHNPSAPGCSTHIAASPHTTQA